LIAAFSACSNGSAPPQPPPPPDQGVPPSGGPADGPHESPPPAAPASKKEPLTANDCKDVAGNSADPTGRVAMNNATTSADAGSSARLVPVLDVVKSRRDAFRCCYDLWSKSNPNAGGKALMVWNLKIDGSLEKVAIDKSKSTLTAPDFEACMVSIATGL